MGLKETFVLPLAKRWISGVTMDSAMADAKKANSKGIGVLVNFLGEEIRTPWRPTHTRPNTFASSRPWLIAGSTGSFR